MIVNVDRDGTVLRSSNDASKFWNTVPRLKPGEAA
jgi:hypothetical protein